MAVGAVGSVGRQLGSKAQSPGHACAQSTGKLSNGETSNEMYWLAAEGGRSYTSQLTAKLAPQPAKAAEQSMCYSLVWQVDFASQGLR